MMAYPIKKADYGTYRWLMREVGMSIGLPPDQSIWTHEQESRVDSIVQSGYEQLLRPASLDSFENEYVKSEDGEEGESKKDRRKRPPHTWSFMSQIGTLAIKANQHQYDLPDDFSGAAGDLVIQSGHGRIPIVSEEHLRQLLAAA